MLGEVTMPPPSPATSSGPTVAMPRRPPVTCRSTSAVAISPATVAVRPITVSQRPNRGHQPPGDHRRNGDPERERRDTQT